MPHLDAARQRAYSQHAMDSAAATSAAAAAAAQPSFYDGGRPVSAATLARRTRSARERRPSEGRGERQQPAKSRIRQLAMVATDEAALLGLLAAPLPEWGDISATSSSAAAAARSLRRVTHVIDIDCRCSPRANRRATCTWASSASSRTSRQPTSRSRSVHSRWLAAGGVDGSAAWHSFGDGSPRGRCRVRPRGPPSPSTPTLFQAAAIDVTCACICDGMSDRACVCVCVYEHEHGHARRRSRRRGRRRMHRRRRRRSRRRSRRRGRRSCDDTGGVGGVRAGQAACTRAARGLAATATR